MTPKLTALRSKIFFFFFFFFLIDLSFTIICSVALQSPINILYLNLSNLTFEKQ